MLKVGRCALIRKALPSTLHNSCPTPQPTQDTQPLYAPSAPVLALNTSSYLSTLSPLPMGEGSCRCSGKLTYFSKSCLRGGQKASEEGKRNSVHVVFSSPNDRGPRSKNSKPQIQNEIGQRSNPGSEDQSRKVQRYGSCSFRVKEPPTPSFPSHSYPLAPSTIHKPPAAIPLSLCPWAVCLPIPR